MPIIARFLWIAVFILLVLAIYTSVVEQNEDTAGHDDGPTVTQHTRDTPGYNTPGYQSPVADDPPVPTHDGGYAGDTQTASSADIGQIVTELSGMIPMSIDDAYAAIPHKRTTYAASRARISQTESTYLEQLFALTDQMTAARVAALTRMYYGYGGMSVEDYNAAYDRAMQGFSTLQPPKPALEAHRQIVKAITEQHAFLNDWNNAGTAEQGRIKNNYGRNAKVQSAHKRLLAAYGVLMRAYSHDDATNKTSFYDHLCALDFI